MATIQVKNVGPIKDTGRITLTRITLLLGPQGAGKSTLMKILCFCRWIEKEIMRDSKKRDLYTRYKRFFKNLKSFHRLSDDFFSSESEIVYHGDAFSLHWKGNGNQNVAIRQTTSSARSAPRLHNPKISFIPAERNLVSAISNVDRNYRSSPWEDLLFNFVLELEEARKPYNAKAPLGLSIDSRLEFFHSSGQHLIKMKMEDLEKTLPAYYASSGIQSAFPIDIIANYLFNSIGQAPKMTASDALRLIFAKADKEEEGFISEVKVSDLRERLLYSSMQLYIEEPEQNLYPEAQRRLVLSLLNLIHRAKEKETHPSTLFITTHSPYLLSVINTQLAVARAYKYIEGLDDEGERQRRKQELDNFLGTNGRHLGSEEYSAYFINNGGLTSLIQEPEEFPMIDGLDLDGVSDWVDDYNDNIRDIIYGDASL